MHLSTKKIAGIVLATLVLSALLLFVPNQILRSYLLVGVLVAAISASIILMGWAKMRGM